MDTPPDEDIDELRQEVAFLRERMAGLEALLYLEGRPLLPADEELLGGYLTLEREERRFSAFAITQHPDLVLAWYRYLTLLEQGVKNTNSTPTHNFTTQHQMAVHLICVGAGTAKLILDAGLAGYYAQAITLIRHLFETWLRLIYVQLRPEMASTWFVGSKGQDAKPPGENKIHSYLMSHTKGDLKKTVRMVIRNLQNFNLMAHPTHMTFQQTVGLQEGRFNVGANYDAELCVYVLHEGASALRLNLTTMQDFFPQPVEWLQEFRSIEQEQRSVLEHERRTMDRWREQVRSDQRWIRGTGEPHQDGEVEAQESNRDGR